MKVLCPEPESFSLKGLNFCKENSNLSAIAMSQSDFEISAVNFDTLLIRFNTKINDKIINQNSKVKYIISPTTGLDHIDMKLTKKYGVKVFHLRGQKKFLNSVTGTAELAVGIMISLLRNIHDSFESVKHGFWDVSKFRGFELSGKKIGVIGCGRLGRMFAKVCVALRMNVSVFDPGVKRFPSGVKRVDSLEEIYSNSDIISIHIPLNSSTKHLISYEEIKKLKPGVILINTSRGSIINNSALLDGLLAKKIGGAALDVIENEHSFLGKQHPLVKYAIENNNLLITPHIGGATYESVEKTDLYILNKFFNNSI